MEEGPPVRAYRSADQTTRCCVFLREEVVSVSGKGGGYYRHVRLAKPNESEPFEEASKS
jgi:hypothetical protein